MKKNQHPTHKIRIYFILLFFLCFAAVKIKAAGTYTLTNNDVTIKYGVITACSNTNNATHIIIPDSLQNQEVTEIEEKIFENMGIAQITLPSPKAKNFLQWKSGDNQIYSSGDTTNNVSTSYTAYYNPNMPYTLQDKDVRIDGRGELYMCKYNFSSKILIFPDSLQNIEIKDITADFAEKGITSLRLPNKLQCIREYAFVDNEIESLFIPDNYIEMGEAIFNGNKINQINGHPSNGIIYAKKTDGTNDSTRIISYGGASKTVDFIPDQVKYIFPESFDLCDIQSLTLPSELTFIGEFAFSDNQFTSFVFPGNAEWVDQNGKTYAPGSSFTDFYVAYTLNISHTLTDADVTVKENHIIEFKNTHKASFITIPDSLYGQPIIGVREGVFANKGIVKVELPKHNNMANFNGWISFDANNISLQNGEYAINNFTKSDILKYYFHKTYIAKLPAYTLTSMDVEMKNETMESCKFHYMVNERVDYSLDPPQAYYDTLDLSGKLIIPDTLDGQAVKHFKKAIFNEYCIKKLKLPSTLCTIAISAFAYNEIDSIIIPANVTAIEGGAFQNYWKSIKDGISYLEFENGSRLKKIGAYAFSENHNLDQFLYLPDSLEKIESGAFKNSGIDYIDFPKAIKFIDDEAFAGCDIRGDNYLIWPKKCEIEFIGKGAFADNLRIDLDGGFILPWLLRAASSKYR